MPLIELSMTGRPKSSRVVGIDLGTTNSLVAYMTESGPQVIRDEQGNALVPSIVYYDTAEQRLLVGEEAGQPALDRHVDGQPPEPGIAAVGHPPSRLGQVARGAVRLLLQPLRDLEGRVHRADPVL